MIKYCAASFLRLLAACAVFACMLHCAHGSPASHIPIFLTLYAAAAVASC